MSWHKSWEDEFRVASSMALFNSHWRSQYHSIMHKDYSVKDVRHRIQPINHQLVTALFVQRSSFADPCLAVPRGYNAMRVKAPNVQSFLSFITQPTIRSASRRKQLPSVCIPACIEDNRAQQNTLESPSGSSSRGSRVWSRRSLKFPQGKVSLYIFCTMFSLFLSLCLQAK